MSLSTVAIFFAIVATAYCGIVPAPAILAAPTIYGAPTVHSAAIVNHYGLPLPATAYATPGGVVYSPALAAPYTAVGSTIYGAPVAKAVLPAPLASPALLKYL